MRRTIAGLALALLVVTAGCSAMPGATTDATNRPTTDEPTDAPTTGAPTGNVDAPQSTAGMESLSGRTVAIGATGRAEAAPDQAIVRVGVTARADSVETVRQQLAQNASRMRTALGEAGVGPDQIASARYDIGRNYRHEERPEEPAYVGSHSFVLTLDDPDRAGEVVVTAVQNGATEVDGVEFTVSPETRRDLREKAVADAVSNARSQASVAATGANLQLDGVRTVRTADVSTDPVRREYALASGGDGGGGTSFESGTVTVTAEVLVVYEATAA